MDRELTYRIAKFSNSGKRTVKVIRHCKPVSDGIVSIPSGREDLIPEGYEIKDKRVDTKVKFPKFKFNLRDSQQAILDQVDSSCIINAQPSWGSVLPSSIVI